MTTKIDVDGSAAPSDTPGTTARVSPSSARPGSEASLRSPVFVIGASVVGLLVLAALFASWIAPYDPLDPRAGLPLEGPSGEHLLGTDNVGHDIFSQIIWGARPSLIVAVEAATLVVIAGGLVGLVSALLGGWTDLVIARVIDVFLALPGLPSILLIAALVGPGRSTVVLAITLFGWPRVARIVRSQALSLRQRGFIAVARGLGGGPFYLLRRHLAPALGPILVTGFVNVAGVAILVEAGLAFLGLADPSEVTWGSILNEALAYPALYFSLLWTWWVLPAGMVITLAVLGFTFLGVGLEPRFNPRWRSGT